MLSPLPTKEDEPYWFIIKLSNRPNFMQHPHKIVQRFRRTDQDRLGQWSPIGSSWKTPASSGLVAHDIYHHLDGDTGTFSQEVRTLGAEWFVDMQPLSGGFEQAQPWHLKNFLRNCEDLVLNAWDARRSGKASPFDLAADEPTPRLNDREIAFFREASAIALGHAQRLQPGQQADRFEHAFVSQVLAGYHRAQARFPDQARVRQASLGLTHRLSAIELDEVPYGHEITVTLDGYDCSIAFDDADATFLAETSVVPALLMRWCSCAHGFPFTGISLHLTEGAYHDFLQEHFREEEDAQDLEYERRIIPQSEAVDLRKVYLKNPALQAVVQRDLSLRLPMAAMDKADWTPRGVCVL